MSFRSNITRVRTYSIPEVFEIRSDVLKRKQKTAILEGCSVDFSNVKFKVFKKSIACVECNLYGSFFALEKWYDGRSGNVSTLNLYGIDKEGNEVLLTKDHILAKARGGTDSISNLQTMCFPCNHKKSHFNADEAKMLESFEKQRLARSLSENIEELSRLIDVIKSLDMGEEKKEIGWKLQRLRRVIEKQSI